MDERHEKNGVGEDVQAELARLHAEVEKETAEELEKLQPA